MQINHERMAKVMLAYKGIGKLEKQAEYADVSEVNKMTLNQLVELVVGVLVYYVHNKLR